MWFQELSSSIEKQKEKKNFQLCFADRSTICYLYFQLISQIFKTHNSQIKPCTRVEICKEQRLRFILVGILIGFTGTFFMLKPPFQ